MYVTPSSVAKLIAYQDGKIFEIANRVLRKPLSVIDQNRKLKQGSVLITCNYIFRDRPHPFSRNVRAICHPFRDGTIFPADRKVVLFSESDFCDALVSPANRVNIYQQYDFVYFTINSMQGIDCKGLYMLSAIDKAASIAGMKGLVINYGPPVQKVKVINKRTPEFLLKRIRKSVGSLKSLTWRNQLLSNQEVCDVMKASKFVLFPNTRDASPRLIPEALIRGVPVLVNEHIYGGWKYVNNATGLFFEGFHLKDCFRSDFGGIHDKVANDLAVKFKEMHQINPEMVASTFYRDYGFKNSAKRFASIINEISRTSYEYVCYKEFSKALKKTT